MDKTSKGIRLEFIDIAKGILIMCMLFGHVNVYGPMDGVQDRFMNLMSYPCVIFSAFFMQAFFIITGYCSTFNVDFKVFLWKNVKILLIPSILLFLFSEFFKLIVFSNTFSLLPFYKLITWVANGAPWFIMAMFLAKLIYWPISRMKWEWQLLLLLIIYLSGLLSHYYIPNYNYAWFQHTFLLIPYLFIGRLIRIYCLWDNLKLLRFSAIVFSLIIIIQVFLSSLEIYVIPSHDHSICITFENFPIHVLNSILGTFFIIYISKRISCSRFLSTLGTGTLIIYLLNGVVYRSIIRISYSIYNSDNLLLCVFFHFFTFILCYVVFYLLVRVVYRYRSLSWIVGKW